MTEYLYLSPRLDGVAVVSNGELAATSERHAVALDVGELTG